MSLSRVIVASEVVWAGFCHAMSTEHQEIMGLLIGDINHDKSIATVKRSLMLSRKDRQKDRVEVGCEDLARATTIAEELSNIDGCKNTVIGWYHSHPHITVLPSHVDVRTQGNYQCLDSGFIGLIFSVFDKNHMEMCAFQAFQDKKANSWDRLEIPIVVNRELHDHGLESVLSVALGLLSEEKELFGRKYDLEANEVQITRKSLVYKNSILRLIDLQLNPLRLALRSRIESLKVQRDILRLQQSSNLSLPPPSSSSLLSTCPNAPRDFTTEVWFRSVNALTLEKPSWMRGCGAVELMLQGVTASRIFCTSLPSSSSSSFSSSSTNRAVPISTTICENCVVGIGPRNRKMSAVCSSSSISASAGAGASGSGSGSGGDRKEPRAGDAGKSPALSPWQLMLQHPHDLNNWHILMIQSKHHRLSSGDNEAEAGSDDCSVYLDCVDSDDSQDITSFQIVLDQEKMSDSSIQLLREELHDAMKLRRHY